MADPFSVTGSAVGVISLGLTVCQGLIAYYGKFKAFHEQIDEVTDQMAALESILKVLQHVLINASVLSTCETAPSAAAAIGSILKCHEGLNKLGRMLEKCDATKSAGSSTGHNKQISRLLYPFRRETLMALTETMSCLQANLNTSLQVLNISLLTLNHKRMDLLVTGSASIASNTSHILSMANRLDQNSLSVDSRLEMLEQHLDRMESNIACVGARLIVTPALLRSLLDDQKMAAESTGFLMAKSQHHRVGDLIGCTCSHRSQFSSWTRQFARQPAILNQACPVHDQHEHTTLFIKRWTLYNRFLGYTIRISLDITKGAGGLAISPHLEFRATVPTDSPIFRLLSNTEDVLKSKTVSRTLENTQQKLFELLREGKGSWSDTLPNGNTILHTITGWQLYSSQWDANSWLRWRIFLKAISQMGPLSTRLNDNGETPADKMIKHFDVYESYRESRQRQGTIDICSDLLNARGFMTHMALDWRHHPTHFNPFYHMSGRDGRMNDHIFEDNSIRLIWQISDEKETQDIDVPEELLPLVYRSSDHLISLLRRGVDLQQWVNSYVQWPTGLALILESGHTPNLNSLTTACDSNCVESIKILINSQKLYIDPAALQTACNHPNTMIMELIVAALADRRRQLQILVETHLPEEVHLELGISPGTLMSRQAYKAYQLLKASSIDVDGIVERTSWSVYDYIGINLKSADLLWDSGFRDVDEIDGNTSCIRGLWHSSPPCSLDVLLEKANWLINKGASITRRKDSCPALHYLGHDVGKLLHSLDDFEGFLWQMHELSRESIQLMFTIFMDESQDDCCCPCSSTGCSGLTAFLRGMFPTRSDKDLDELINRLAIVIEALTSSHVLPSQERLIDLIAPSVLRFVTCRRLNISHTCIHDYYGGIDAEEIEEIQDEERLLILELEGLLAEFVQTLENLSLSFPDFLTGYWRARMKEVESLSGVPSAEASAKILETGVILYE